MSKNKKKKLTNQIENKSKKKKKKIGNDKTSVEEALASKENIPGNEEIMKLIITKSKTMQILLTVI